MGGGSRCRRSSSRPISPHLPSSERACADPAAAQGSTVGSCLEQLAEIASLRDDVKATVGIRQTTTQEVIEEQVPVVGLDEEPAQRIPLFQFPHSASEPDRDHRSPSPLRISAPGKTAGSSPEPAS